MKRLYLIMMTVLLMVSFAGCSSTKKETYEGEGYSIEYFQDWTVEEQEKPQEGSYDVEFSYTPSNSTKPVAGITITRQQYYYTRITPEIILKELSASMNASCNVTSYEECKVGDLDGYTIHYEFGDVTNGLKGQLVFTVANNCAYIAQFTSNYNQYDTVSKAASQMLSSFAVTENGTDYIPYFVSHSEKWVEDYDDGMLYIQYSEDGSQTQGTCFVTFYELPEEYKNNIELFKQDIISSANEHDNYEIVSDEKAEISGYEGYQMMLRAEGETNAVYISKAAICDGYVYEICYMSDEASYEKLAEEVEEIFDSFEMNIQK